MKKNSLKAMLALSVASGLLLGCSDHSSSSSTVASAGDTKEMSKGASEGTSTHSSADGHDKMDKSGCPNKDMDKSGCPSHDAAKKMDKSSCSGSGENEEASDEKDKSACGGASGCGGK